MTVVCPTRSDTVRYALDILSILTVVPKTQLLLSEPVAVFDEGGTTVSTVGRCSHRQSSIEIRLFVSFYKHVALLHLCVAFSSF